ncbi:hypothetical protein [Bacteroides sp.]
MNDNPLNGANRPNGLPVRCVQELTNSLLLIVVNVCIGNFYFSSVCYKPGVL